MRKRMFIFLCIVLLILISFQYDYQIVKGITSIQTDYLTNFFMGLTFISSEIIIFLFLTSLFLWSEKKRKWILPLWFTLFASVVVSFIIKFAVQRPRPFQLGLVSIASVLEKANFATWNFSFPSFQTMFVFSAIPILSKQFLRLKRFWLILAILVGFSRVYFGLHFLSDVLAGGFIGYFIGLWIIRLEQEKRWGTSRAYPEKSLEKIFTRGKELWKKLFKKKR